MTQIGVSICPIMTRDMKNPIYCSQDRAVFYKLAYPSVGHNGYCGLMSEKVIKI